MDRDPIAAAHGGIHFDGLRPGQTRAVCTCSHCGTAVEFACAKNNYGHARRKLQQHGWSVSRKHIFCEKCVAKAKTISAIRDAIEEAAQRMSSDAAPDAAYVQPAPLPFPATPSTDEGPAMASPSETPPRQPSREQRREIMQMLQIAYDMERQCYSANDSDDSLAAVLKVLPAWVAEIREEFFGPSGESGEMRALSDHLGSLSKDAVELADALVRAAQTVTKLQAAVDKQAEAIKNAQARLDAIRQAVGPRVMKIAKVV